MVRIVGPVAIEVHAEILFAPGGQIRRWASGVAREQTANTKAEAPVNKRTRKFPGNPPRGYLKSTISSSVTSVTPLSLAIDTSTDADYAVYVIKGTSTRYARDALGRFGFAAEGFPLPTNNFGKFRRVQRVRGQKPNNFFVRGKNRTARNHPSLRVTSSLRRF
jgi:hypothetical protein